MSIDDALQYILNEVNSFEKQNIFESEKTTSHQFGTQSGPPWAVFEILLLYSFLSRIVLCIGSGRFAETLSCHLCHIRRKKGTFYFFGRLSRLVFFGL